MLKDLSILSVHFDHMFMVLAKGDLHECTTKSQMKLNVGHSLLGFLIVFL